MDQYQLLNEFLQTEVCLPVGLCMCEQDNSDTQRAKRMKFGIRLNYKFVLNFRPEKVFYVITHSIISYVTSMSHYIDVTRSNSVVGKEPYHRKIIWILEQNGLVVLFWFSGFSV